MNLSNVFKQRLAEVRLLGVGPVLEQLLDDLDKPELARMPVSGLPSLGCDLIGLPRKIQRQPSIMNSILRSVPQQLDERKVEVMVL